MRRNKRGVAGINARRAKQEIVAAQGEKMERDELAHLDEQFKLFKTRLEAPLGHLLSKLHRNSN